MKRRHRKEKQASKNARLVSSAPPVPPLTPQRRGRGLGALDVFRESPLRRQLFPTVSDEVVAPPEQRRNLAQSFRSLQPEIQAEFIAQARSQNAQRLAKELSEAGSVEEAVRGL